MRAFRIFLACLVAGLTWVFVEVGGGLLFLAAGVRLWRYEIAPIWFDITSPVVWLLAVVLVVPLGLGFQRLAGGRLRGSRRGWGALLFLMSAGPVVEVALNELVFKGLFGTPLYRYLVLPTWGGSGSLLSPLYYGTLILHLPITERILGGESGREPEFWPSC